MSEKEDFAQRIANYTPVQPKDVAYQAEVDKVKYYFHNCLDDSNFGSLDITRIPYLDSYGYVSKADATEYKRQLQKLKKQMSQKEGPDKQLMDNIKRALDDVERQLREFHDLSR